MCIRDSPYGVRIAKDPKWGEVVYVADSNNNRVQVFTKTGVFKASIGRTGPFSETGTFTTMRRVAVAKDGDIWGADPVSYTHLRAHETVLDLVCRLLL